MREPLDPNDPSYNTNVKPNKQNKDKIQYTQLGQQQVFLHIDSYIKKIKGAPGIMFIKDQAGKLDYTGFGLGYASKFRVRSGKLSIGAHFRFLNGKPNSSPWNTIEKPDPLEAEFGQDASFLDFDMNFGLHYKAPTWHVGVSGTQLIGTTRISGAEITSLRPTRQFYLSGGYIWNLKTAVPWSIEPSVLFLTHSFATWTVYAMALARYNGILYFGLTYQLNNGVGVALGAVPFYNSTNEYLKGLEIGAAYNFDTKKTGYRPGGSFGDFEILVRYGFNFYKDKPLTGYGSTRHLYKNQY
jgi:type IX secretion system PorP/SprF family membrane protein